MSLNASPVVTPPNGGLAPKAFRWDRAWVTLGSHHVEYLSREADRLGLHSPSSIVQRLIEEAMVREETALVVGLYRWRSERNLSQRDAARRVGLSLAVWALLESGRLDPTAEESAKLRIVLADAALTLAS